MIFCGTNHDSGKQLWSPYMYILSIPFEIWMIFLMSIYGKCNLDKFTVIRVH